MKEEALLPLVSIPSKFSPAKRMIKCRTTMAIIGNNHLESWAHARKVLNVLGRSTFHEYSLTADLTISFSVLVLDFEFVVRYMPSFFFPLRSPALDQLCTPTDCLSHLTPAMDNASLSACISEEVRWQTLQPANRGALG